MSNPRRIFVAGANGMVGSALVRALEKYGEAEILAPPRKDLDLLDQRAVGRWMIEERPDYIFVAAAKVGGILANDEFAADFLYENLVIEANLIRAAHLADVDRLMFLGSSCIYPRDCPQPIREEYLLSGPLEKTNEAYAIAKIAGIKLCETHNRQYGRRYVSVMPTNLYGPNDNYDLHSSHVLPALLRKAHEAKLSGAAALEIWGSGTPRREFLHVDDLADACIFLMQQSYDGPILNIGTGEDITIAGLAQLVCDAVGFEGTLRFDHSRPDGTPRKLLDVGRLRERGWSAKISLPDGILDTYRQAPFYRQEKRTVN